MRTVSLVAALLFLLGAPAPAEAIKRMEPLLGTYVEITLEGGSREELQAAADAGFDAFREVDRLLSSFREDSELNQINRLAGVRPVGVSSWTYECLGAAGRVSRDSRGAFDATCRPLLELWGFLSRKYRVPSARSIAQAKALVDYRRLELRSGPSVRTAFLADRGMKLDLGGIGKGFAVDKAVAALKDAGVRSGRVRAWGDCFGFGDRDWKIEVEPGKEVVLRNEACSTSGAYENFFERGKRHYAHIVDPRTGLPVEGVRSVTVKAPSCTESDAWSTAIFVEKNPRLKPGQIQVVYDERQAAAPRH